MYQREVQRKNEIPFNLIDIILLFFNGASLDQEYIYIYSDKLWLHWMVFELFFYNVTIKYISKIPDGQYLAE